MTQLFFDLSHILERSSQNEGEGGPADVATSSGQISLAGGTFNFLRRIVYLFVTYSVFFVTQVGWKHSQLNAQSHLILADVLENVACQGGNLNIFEILVSNAHSCAPAVQSLVALFIVPFLTLFNIYFQFSLCSILLSRNRSMRHPMAVSTGES
jgi:hypothetical protein